MCYEPRSSKNKERAMRAGQSYAPRNGATSGLNICHFFRQGCQHSAAGSRSHATPVPGGTQPGTSGVSSRRRRLPLPPRQHRSDEETKRVEKSIVGRATSPLVRAVRCPPAGAGIPLARVFFYTPSLLLSACCGAV